MKLINYFTTVCANIVTFKRLADFLFVNRADKMLSDQKYIIWNFNFYPMPDLI